jgi:hypothetical protein
VVEFVIIGNLTNSIDTLSKSSGNNELFLLMNQKAASQSLKRIMKIVFILGCFYLGLPFGSYLMFKGKNAIEVTFVQQLALYSYSFAAFIPVSILVLGFHAFYRVRLALLVVVWTV